MSIYRVINGKNNDLDFLEKKRKYITDDVKTDGGKLVGTSACLYEHGIDDWISVKKAYHKSNGKQGEHIALSITPDRKNVSNEEYLQIAEEVADLLFQDYNCIYAVHIDSTYRHIHFLLNSVSYVDGKRFHSSKSDLAQTRAAVNRILERHNFDIISSSTDNMIDDTPYDLESGFEPLEITDDKPYEDPFKDILIDFDDDNELYDYLDGKTSKAKKKPRVTIVPKYEESPENNSENKGEKINMFNYDVFKNNGNVSTAVPAVNTPSQDLSQPVVQAAQESPVAFPTMILNFNPKITINATPDTTAQDIRNYLNAATPKINSTNSLKCAVGMASELDSRNIHMNIEANLFPDITINFVEPDKSDNSPSDENVIDIEPEKVW
jgi:mobilisation protein